MPFLRRAGIPAQESGPRYPPVAHHNPPEEDKLMARNKAAETLAYLIENDPGEDKDMLSIMWGISIPGVRARIKACREWLKEHPEQDWAIPRPTADNNWKFRAVHKLRMTDGGDIRGGQLDDNTAILGFLSRMLYETEVAYNDFVKSSRAGIRSIGARRMLARMGHIQALIDSIQGDQAVLSTF